ncbi:MAG TPA: ABC transporter ATP-binding protein [Dehalococcoidia bacterium]|nr:ABC transporter ATP-binding protein [Dehalococcoidia bacterium]
MNETLLLSASGLSKTYGSGETAVAAVRDVDVTARRGEFIAIVGPSGSGKTTLLAMIGGLLTPTSGSVMIEGRDVAKLGARERARYRRESVGYVFQANNLLPFLTARENMTVVAAIGGGDRRAAGRRADLILEELGISNRTGALATELSGGERQRVAIGRSLMNDPALILVDEPTASLDSARGRQVVELLAFEVRSRDKLGIMVTHDDAMASLADRFIELSDGSLVGAGSSG